MTPHSTLQGEALLCPLCCAHQHGRTIWPYAEAVRRRAAKFDLAAFVGHLPERIDGLIAHGKWAKTSSSLAAHGVTDLPSLAEWVSTANVNMPKSMAQVFAGATSRTGRLRDEDAIEIYLVTFDSDGAGAEDQLVEAMSRAGLGAVVQPSISGRPNCWHATVSLARPFLPDASDLLAWKRIFAHLAGVFSSLAGFQGVGGKCGFDLTTDRLIQPVFPGSQPALYLPGGALDLDLMLAATGYDDAAAQRAAKRAKPPRPTGRSLGARERGHFRDDWPLLRAFKVDDRVIGAKPGDDGWHVRCPNENKHSSENPRSAWIDALAGRFHCSRRYCKVATPHEVAVASLSGEARRVYDLALEQDHFFRVAAKLHGRPKSSAVHVDEATRRMRQVVESLVAQLPTQEPDSASSHSETTNDSRSAFI